MDLFRCKWIHRIDLNPIYGDLCTSPTLRTI